VETEKRAGVERHERVDDFEEWWEGRKERLQESLQSQREQAVAQRLSCEAGRPRSSCEWRANRSLKG